MALPGNFSKRYVPQVETEKAQIVLPQLGAKIEKSGKNRETTVFSQQVAANIRSDLFSVPWGHHKYIMDKCSSIPQKALFFVHQTVLNGWSRSMLLNFLDTDLYERQGKALTRIVGTRIAYRGDRNFDSANHLPCPSNLFSWHFII